MAGVVRRITGVLERASSWSNRTHRLGIAGLADSLRCSLQDRRFTLIYWDGQDWCYRWRGGALYYPTSVSNARSLTEDNWALFTYGSIPGPGDTVMDVGAGVGTEIMAYCRSVGESGTVIAVEADPDSIRRLRKMVETLHLRQVRVVHAAVASEPGTAQLTRGTIEGVVSSIMEREQSVFSISVPQTTIPTILEELEVNHVDHLKMNIEGAEAAALRGMSRFPHAVSHWCVSCHDFIGRSELATMDFVLNWFQDNGYRTRVHPEVADRPWVGNYVYADPVIPPSALAG